ncbi:MAG: repressor LexA [Succinivibrionaceae bacterium]|nr:repressor LexA [Succinivibrionaceae bacterium]
MAEPLMKQECDSDIIDFSCMAKASRRASGLKICVPLVGHVAAGSPIDSSQHYERMLEIDPAMFDFVPDYFLKVRGCSMINAGIMDGDMIGIHKIDPSRLRNGQIVVARVNQSEVTVKRYRRVGDTVWLMPENDEMSPIKVDLTRDSLEIDGIYVGLFQE